MITREKTTPAMVFDPQSTLHPRKKQEHPFTYYLSTSTVQWPEGIQSSVPYERIRISESTDNGADRILGRGGKAICRIDDYSSNDVSLLPGDGKGPI